MDRKAIYEEWQNKKVEGQNRKLTKFCDERTIKKVEQICDRNFYYYVQYQNYLEDGLNKKEITYSSLKTKRSKILNFLISKELGNQPLEIMNQETLDKYFNRICDSVEEQTFVNAVNNIKSFLKYLNEKGYILNNYDFPELKNLTSKTEKNSMKPLTAEQISKFYDRYKDKPEYLYIFDMEYYTDFDDNVIENLSMDNVDIVNKTVTLGNKKITVPTVIIDHILRLEKKNKLGRLLTVISYFSKFKPIFQEMGFNNIKPKDIKETREKLSFRCPQCGKTYEAIVDNWCVVQYTENGKLWIVCRDCGRKYENEA